MKTVRILVVEKDESMNKAIADILKSMNQQDELEIKASTCNTVEGGIDAVESENPPDIIVLGSFIHHNYSPADEDKLTGLDVIWKIKELKLKKIKVVLIVSYGSGERVNGVASKKNVNIDWGDVLTKPLSADDLVGRVRKIIDEMEEE